MRIAVILGTRPEIIKMAPIINELRKNRIDHYVIHSGQHYSYNMNKIFFEQLKIRKPKHMLDVGSSNSVKQTAMIMEGVGKVLLKDKVDVVMIQGDTNTVLGGAVAAKKNGVEIAHVEAGLRSFDDSMPEETNRIVADHCSDYLFAPTKVSQNNLLREGISRERIFVTGNTIVDAVKENLKNSYKVIERYNLDSKKYFLVSLHRQENVDEPKRFARIIKGLKMIAKKQDTQIVFPIHPRSEKMAKRFGIRLDGVDVIKPVDYFSFLSLEKNARLVFTDSGGVQEETCILRTPCVTLRDNTERPETVAVKANIIAGTEPRNIVLSAEKMLKRKLVWKNPYGNGDSAKRILKILRL